MKVERGYRETGREEQRDGERGGEEMRISTMFQTLSSTCTNSFSATHEIIMDIYGNDKRMLGY